ncbi:MAG: hypothetical protein IJW98_04120 [Clostridia bacterium]|nr:hypothetical protein [Clostridia bacterium]
MKQFSKWLALLMAGLVLSAALLSCDDGYDWSEEEDGDDDEEQSESSSQYKNLTPEELWDAILEAKDFTIVMEGTRTGSNPTSIVTYTINKDGGKLMIAMKNQTDYTIHRKAYFDLENHLAYQEDDNGQWTYQEQEDLELDDLLDDLLPVDLLFEKSSYEEYDPENGIYVMKSREIAEEVAGDAGLTCQGELKVQGSTYTFIYSAEEEPFKLEFTVTIEFQSEIVKLPDAKPAENEGEAVPDIDEH